MAVSRRTVRKSLRTNFDPGPRDRLNRVVLRGRQALNLPALVAGGRLDRPVFVIGAPRSGTSLLYSILRSHPAVAHWPGEAHEVWEADYHPALGGWVSNVLGAGDVEPAAAARIRRALFLAAGPRRRLVDKTPRNSLRVEFVDHLFPDARFVHLHRDGRDNVNSLINAWRTPRYRTYELPEPHSIPGADPRWWKFVLYPGWRDDVAGPLEVVCARQWIACNEHALDALAPLAPERRVAVRFESLVADCVAETARILDAVGLDFADAVRRRAEAAATTPVNVVTPPERGKWRRENPEAIARVEPLLEPVMERMGYRDED